MSKDYLLVENSGIELHSGDVVIIASYGDTRWVLKQGWYKLGNAQKNGWYFLSLSDKSVVPVTFVDLEEVSLSDNQSVKPSDAKNNDEYKYVVIPGTNIRLYDGDVVRVSKYPKSKWFIHCGWYICNTKQNYGWYLSNVKTGKVMSIDVIDLTTCTLIDDYKQGDDYKSGQELAYTRPFTDSDAEILTRSFITVDTIEQRDNLDPHKMANGRLVRVNDVEGAVAYYAWDENNREWTQATLGDSIPKIVGTPENPIILSTLPPDTYLIYGQYKICPEDPTTYVTLSNILSLVNDSEDVQYVKVIDNTSITDYVVEDGAISVKSVYLTDSYILDKYATIEYVDSKFSALESQIQAIEEILSTLNLRIREIAQEEDRLYSTDIAKTYIDNLFNN